MEAGINNIIYMELHSGPKMVNGTCGKMIIAGMTDRDSTVYRIVEKYHMSKEWRNKQNSVVIHALPFAWYLVGNF